MGSRLYDEIIRVYRKVRTAHVNKLCGKVCDIPAGIPHKEQTKITPQYMQTLFRCVRKIRKSEFWLRHAYLSVPFRSVQYAISRFPLKGFLWI
jgi:hypothetical protein